MSSNHGLEPLKPLPASPQRPRHQIRRSITELSSPIKLPRYHHIHHLHQRRDRDPDDRTPVSASPMLNLPRGSLELPRSEGATPGISSATRSKFNMMPLGAEDVAHVADTNMAREPAPSEEGQFRQRREKAASRTAGLTKSLVDLSAFSNATMRRLDDTYYSVLEKLTMLQNTVVVLKELASMSQEVDETFKAESQGLVREIESQLGSLDQFDEQQERIQELQGRIHAGRERVLALSTRVDAVRGRIEGWERADREWQERTRRRLKVIWIIMSVLAFAMMLLFFGARYAPSSEDVSLVTKLAPGNQDGRPSMGELPGNHSKSAASTTDELREALIRRRGDGQAQDEVFRAFDEL